MQPYWLVVPKDYDFAAKSKKHRLDFWWHGRGETLSEVNFMASSPGTGGIIPAPGAIVLHPYGRYCNANKFAGEIDRSRPRAREEALPHRRRPNRRPRLLDGRGRVLAVRRPLPDALVRRARPGPGFAETPEFLKVFQKETVQPTWYEKKLWHLYDATDYAQNLFNLPTVAYSGEIDRQKQAADVMAREMKKDGLELDAHHRPEDRARLREGREGGGQQADRRDRGEGRDGVPGEVQVHDVHAPVQPGAWASISTAWRSTGSRPASRARGTKTTIIAEDRECHSVLAG